MQLLRELLPAAKRIAVLVNPTDPEGYQTVRDVQAAAGGEQILVRDVASGRDIDAAFTNMARDKMDALFVGPGTFFNTRRVQLAVIDSALWVSCHLPDACLSRSRRTDELRGRRPRRFSSSRCLYGARS